MLVMSCMISCINLYNWILYYLSLTAFGAKSLYHQFYVLGKIAFGQGDAGYGHILEANRLLASDACKVDMSVQKVGVRTCADAILLHASTIVDGMQESLLGKERERAEYGRIIGRGHFVQHILKGECTAMHLFVYHPEHKQSHRGDAYSHHGEKFLVCV